MASIGAQALAAGAISNPVLGFAVMAAGAVIDSQGLYPALMGKGKQAARPGRLFDVQTGSNEAGAPRTTAYGRRVRVPTHVLWQNEKVRESGVGSAKAGTAVQQRRVYVDALIAVNDRRTVRLTQLIGNGKLLLMRTLNLIDVESAAMQVSEDGSRLILTMSSGFDPDFTTKFAVGDVVQLSGFVSTAGASPNTGYWITADVFTHTTTPSRIELEPYSGQTVAGIVATAGTDFSPAKVTRVDDQLFCEGGSFLIDPAPDTQTDLIRIPTSGHLTPSRVFDLNTRVRMVGFTLPGYGSLAGVTFRVAGQTASQITLQALGVLFNNSTGSTIAITGGSSTNAARVIYDVQPRFAAGYFPSSFDPDAHFQDGADDQEAALILTDADALSGIGLPGYRGVAVQGLDEFYVTQFGDSLPFSMEALIDPDTALTWAQALALVLQRGGVPATAIDVSDINTRPFLGFFMRGPVQAVSAMQPLLLAGSIVGQDRDGVICLFEIANADLVQVENDETLSDLGVQLYGQQGASDKLQIEDVAEEDLPTSVGVRHQDPDNGYADGYQHFGLRNPGGVSHKNEIELDLATLVLTRKEARDLAASHLRREWVNRRRFRFALGANYLDLLENDLVTFTDDDGYDITCRIIQRDIDTTFRVICTAVEEDVDLPVSGSPVESGAGAVPPLLTVPATLRTVFVDAPGLTNDQIVRPSIGLATASLTGRFAGAQVWESQDGGSYVRVGDIGTQAGIGTTVTDLAASSPGEEYGTTAVTFDGAQEVDVTFDNEGPFGLEDATEAEALAGKNWIAIVGEDGSVEIAAFLTADFVSDSTWTLGSLCRGLRGTTPVEWLAGASVVLLHPTTGNGIFVREFAGEIAPTSLAYKIVPAGLSLDDVDAVEVVAEWRNVAPLPVRAISKTIGASPYDARIEVVAHWCKQVLPPGTQPPHPMDELREGYRFTIYDPTGFYPLRTYDLQVEPTTGSPTLRDKWFDYTASEQAADGYTPGPSETFWVDVQQIGDFGLGPSIKQEI